MKFGLFIIGDYHDESVSTSKRFAQCMSQVEMAERLGFHSVWFAEHHANRYGLIGNTLTMAAAAAVRTERVRLGTGIVILPFAHPLRVAEEAAMVDNLSNGRLDLGVGRGYQPREFALFREPMEESRDRFDEALTIIEKALTGEPFSHHGRRWDFDDVMVRPAPVQRPVPIWVAAASMSTFTHMGLQGYRIISSPNFTSVDKIREFDQMYKDGLRRGGFDPSEYSITLQRQTYVGEDEVEAREGPREASVRYHQMLGTLIADKDEVRPGYEMYSKSRSRLERVTYEDILEEAVNYGTVDQVAERLKFQRDELGVDYYLAWFDFGGLPFDLVQASIERFGKEVIPRLAEPPDGEGEATAV